MLIYELERQTDNDNESDSDLQRLLARDTEDLGAIEVFYFQFHFIFLSFGWLIIHYQLIHNYFSNIAFLSYIGLYISDCISIRVNPLAAKEFIRIFTHLKLCLADAIHNSK